MAYAGKTNLFKEKKILQEEEKSLKNMLDKFQDQLNRLKIEELALLSLMKMKSESDDSKAESQTTLSSIGEGQTASTSGYARNPLMKSDGDDFSLPEMIPVGYMQQRTMEEDFDLEDILDINKQDIDLEVPQGLIRPDGRNAFGGDEEEVEEEDESGSDDNNMVDDGFIQEETTNQLRSFLDGF